MARKAKDAAAEAAKQNVDPNKIAECAAEYEELMGQRGRLDQKIGTMLRNYEKHDGVKAASIKRDYRRRNMTTDEVQAELAEDALYARVLGRIEWDAGGQSSFAGAFAEVPKPSGAAADGLARARAHSDGYNSGKHGAKIESCQFPNGSEEFIAWRDGWTDGNADRLMKNPQAAHTTQATPRKRGKAASRGTAPPKNGSGATAGH